jgi:hypothetical protein
MEGGRGLATEQFILYQNQLFENFENQQLSEYVSRLTTERYMSLILRTIQHCSRPTTSLRPYLKNWTQTWPRRKLGFK